jgi:transcriptional regulator with XRE-family HTH domain
LPTFEGRRAAFGTRLREIRENAGLSGTDLAAHLSWQQSKVSKIETGKQTATDTDVVAWLQAAGVSESVVEDFRAELRELQIAQFAWRRQLREGHRATQERLVRDDRNATTMRGLVTMAVPGLLQTPDYARAIFRSQAELLDVPADDVEDSVAARMARQQVLYDRTKQIEFLITEAALANPVCAPEEMVGQLDRLSSVIGVVPARIGVIPAGHTVPHLIPHGFWIYDEEVRFESVSGSQRTTDADEVALYAKLLDRLWTVAVEGDEARAVFARVAAVFGR